MPENVVRLKRRKKPNIALIVIVGIIILYLGINFYRYVSKEHVTVYEVNETSIADDSSFKGFILRNEKVLSADDSGYINFYYANSEKIAKNKVIYTIDKSGKVGDEIEKINSKKEDDLSEISAMREIIDDFYADRDPATYGYVDELHYDVENLIFQQRNANLYSEVNKIISKSLGNDVIKNKATCSGIISYSTDGFENTKLTEISSDTFDLIDNVEKKQVHSSDKVEKGDNVCKLVTDNRWKLVIRLTEDIYKKLLDMETVKITVKRDNVTFEAAPEFMEKDGAYFVVLTIDDYMERYINDRFIEVEFNINNASGLKIPNSSIIEREMTVIDESLVKNGEEGPTIIKNEYDENGKSVKSTVSLKGQTLLDGKYYVDSQLIKPTDTVMNPDEYKEVSITETSKEKGVYCINTGYFEFKKIEVIYNNDEYSIISPNTQGGLCNYDQIVANPEAVNKDGGFLDD